MFFFIFFDISSLLLRYITPAIPRSSRLGLSKNILKNIDSYLNFRTLGDKFKRLGHSIKCTRFPKKGLSNRKLRPLCKIFSFLDYLYPKRLNLTGICWGKWPLSSSYHLDLR